MNMSLDLCTKDLGTIKEFNQSATPNISSNFTDKSLRDLTNLAVILSHVVRFY